MSKLLAVLIGFTYLFASLSAHAVVPLDGSRAGGFPLSVEKSSCHARPLLMSQYKGGEISKKTATANESRHCLFDFVLIVPAASDCLDTASYQKLLVSQKRLHPTLPRYIGKPPKAPVL